MFRNHYLAASVIALALATVGLSRTALAEVTGDPEKIPGWVLVYEVDANNAIQAGSLMILRQAVRAGADIKVLLNEKYSRQCEDMTIFDFQGEEHVACQDFNTVAHILNSDPLIIRPIPYRTYSWYDTAGRLALSRASIYGGSNVGQTVSALDSPPP